MIKQHSYYQYNVCRDFLAYPAFHWVYLIYDPNYKSSTNTIIRESDEWYDTESEANQAAKEHIEALESGER